MEVTTVRLLTEEQAFALGGEQWKKDSFFEPQKDADGNWVISEEEATHNTNPKYDWVKDLPVIEHKPIVQPNPMNFDE